jgi:Domain of unknown function (DUF4333)
MPSACLLLVASLALGGCSLDSIKAKSSISAGSVEAKIAGKLAKTYDVARPPVRCPASIQAQVGAKFTCTATLDGQVLKVDGGVTGSKGQVEVRPASAVVVRATAEDELGSNLESAFGEPVTVSCSIPAILIANPGGHFDCTAHVGRIERQVIVTVTNLAGALRRRVVNYRPPLPVERPSATG